MDEEYHIENLEQPAWDIIGGGINHFNHQRAGEDHAKSLCVVLKTPSGEIVGGAIGATYWDWFHLDLMWVKEELRGKGYGTLILLQAEEEARRRGATYVFLDTFDFQAPEFYKRYGYEVFGELPDFPAGHTRYFMKKRL
jgi:GNAT superfamily N-acetyltransferase